MRPPAALARAQRETNDARQRVAVLARARPQSHDATPSVAAALRQKLQGIQTTYATKAEDIASRAPRRPAENVIRILERHERSSKVRGAFHKIKTRMFQERAVEKEAARRATRDAQLALERKRVLVRARELDSMSDGLEALRDLAHRKRRERFAEIACDTRRAFAFFAAMRPRLARRKLEGRASGIAALLRVRSCFRTLRAQARRGKLVREISRSANRRHARRALRALQLLKLRGVERRIAFLRADRVAKASAARRSIRAFVEGAAFNRTSRQAALLADAAARRRGLTCFALSATAREAARCARHRGGVFRRRRSLRAAFRHLAALTSARAARRDRRRRAALEAAGAARGRGLAALKALVERGRTRSARDALSDAAFAVSCKIRGLAALREAVARAGRRRRRETAACVGERAVALRSVARWRRRVDAITHLKRLTRKAALSKKPSKPKLRAALDAWWALRRDRAVSKARLELAEVWRNRRRGRAALAALFAMRRDRRQQRRLKCVVDEFQKRNDNSHKQGVLIRLARRCQAKRRDRAAFAAALKRRQRLAFPRLQERVAAASAREARRVARQRLRRGVALLRGRVRAHQLRRARTRLAALHRRAVTAPAALLRLQESSARRRRTRVLRRAQHYEALDVASARALRRWRLIAASRKSTRERHAPLVDAALVSLALRRARRFLTEWRSHVAHARATRRAELPRLVDKFRAWRHLTERRRQPPPPPLPRPPVLRRLADDAPVAAPVSLSPPAFVDLVHLKHLGAGPHPSGGAF
jgi:hypothetical protein